MIEQEKQIGYLDSFCADTEVVPQVINRLIFDLEKLGYPEDEIYEIVLSMDESITNAIQETLKKTRDCEEFDTIPKRNITIRYTVDARSFDATIIDHGKGLDIFNIIHSVPNSNSSEYLSQIVRYASESEQQKIRVRINGKEIALKGIGAGLKIILNFMDKVTIDLIDRQKVLATSVSEHTDGTIFNMKRKRRYS
ncbi:MAG TPA: ATP-binding protein [Spirochaetota bacterium]|nr:ATP-binding protein [Spirochaetota bacterium]HPI91027.1 ATP-binding protein [Spirochaetota bacterium]HPR47653.1 ATP-binding protein [Spirochaetota bacterium]